MVAIIGNKFKRGQRVKIAGQEGVWEILTVHPDHCSLKRVDGRVLEKHPNSAISPYLPPKIEGEQIIGGKRPTLDPILMGLISSFFKGKSHQPLTLDSPLWDKPNLVLIPPYREVNQWIEKIFSVHSTVIIVVPNWTGEEWFQGLGNQPICFLKNSSILIILFSRNNQDRRFKDCFEMYGRIYVGSHRSTKGNP